MVDRISCKIAAAASKMFLVFKKSLIFYKEYAGEIKKKLAAFIL